MYDDERSCSVDIADVHNGTTICTAGHDCHGATGTTQHTIATDKLSLYFNSLAQDAGLAIATQQAALA
jgi:hypothetical protein